MLTFPEKGSFPAQENTGFFESQLHPFLIFQTAEDQGVPAEARANVLSPPAIPDGSTIPPSRRHTIGRFGNRAGA